MLFNLRQVGFKVTIYILTSPYSPLYSLYVFLVADKDNLFNNQELLKLVIISFILVALTFVSGVKFHGEIRCSSLLGVKAKVKGKKVPDS